MKARLLHLWDTLNSSYWFVPTAMLVASAVVALLTLWIDRHWISPQSATWTYSGGPAGARSLLSTVAGSVITVAGVVFSITIATLTQASSQFGPRLLRNFMRDVGNQFVLGTFVATFIYCLLILRSVREQNEGEFVPNLSVTIAVLLAVGSIAVLIYFIHHTARSLQGPQVVATVGSELERAIRRPFPAGVGQESDKDSAADTEAPPPAPPEAEVVTAANNGYLQAIDEGSLMRIAEREDAVVFLACRPGDFIIKGNPLLRIGGDCNEATRQELLKLFFLGGQRTAEQDVEYSIRQLVEIAVRALSPGINDPFTAINCIDWLGAAISAIAQQGTPSPNRYDTEGKLRVVARVSDFAGLADASFNQIRQFGGASVAVGLRMLEVIAAAAGQLRTDEQRLVLSRHAEMIYRQCCEEVAEPIDMAAVRARYELARDSLRLKG